MYAYYIIIVIQQYAYGVCFSYVSKFFGANCFFACNSGVLSKESYVNQSSSDKYLPSVLVSFCGSLNS